MLSSPAHRYDPGADLRWLLLRPWQLIGRLTVLLSQLISLAVVLVIQGGSNDPKVQKRLGKRIFTTLTNLGPCFIKLGQALSTRPDLLRRDWLDELTKLQDNLPAFPHAIALQTIEEELGAPVEQLFEEFPDHPVAAASLGQVYKARPVGGPWVAVKVQRPNLTYQLRRDLVLIRLLGVMAAPLLPLNLGFGLGEIIDEFGRSLFEEIDYRMEADNAERFAHLFQNNPAVVVPRVDRSLSGQRVLTTSWINGTKLQERQELEAQRLDPAGLAVIVGDLATDTDARRLQAAGLAAIQGSGLADRVGWWSLLWRRGRGASRQRGKQAWRKRRAGTHHGLDRWIQLRGGCSGCPGNSPAIFRIRLHGRPL